MIIQCAQCNARFRLDDSRVSDAGIKVRCSKCKHIFVVKREAPVEEGDLDVLLQGLDSSASGAPLGAPAGAALAAGTVQAGHPSEPAVPSLDDTSPSSTAVGVEESLVSALAGTSGEGEAGKPFSSFPDESEKDVLSGFTSEGVSEGSGGLEPRIEEGSTAGISGESGDSISDFGLTGEVTTQESAVGAPEAEGITFGEVSPEAFAAATGLSAAGVEGAEEEEISFEFEDDEATGDGEVAGAESAAGGEIDFGEIDFGIEDAEAEAPPADADQLYSPLGVEAPVVSEGDRGSGELPKGNEEVSGHSAVAGVEGEPPPLSIASRRKGKSILPAAVIALSVLVIVALAGFGFYFFKEGPQLLGRFGVGFLAEWLGIESREEGAITLDKVGGVYLANSEAGEVFVIRGEAVNNFRKPRASIQVRGSLLGTSGQAVVQKVAYCGNNLTDEQIKTLPYGRIEAAMGNQFGDSLTNLGVQPGKRIPFVIVIANIPKDVTDYSVEVVGSTVASQ